MNTTRAISREDANLNAFLEQPRERWLEGCYVAEGPLYFAVLALLIAPPARWRTIRVKILRRLLLTAHARAVSLVTGSRTMLFKAHNATKNKVKAHFLSDFLLSK